MGLGRAENWIRERGKQPQDLILVHLISAPNNGSNLWSINVTIFNTITLNRCYFLDIYHAPSTVEGLFLLQQLLILKVLQSLRHCLFLTGVINSQAHKGNQTKITKQLAGKAGIQTPICLTLKSAHLEFFTKFGL